jgi:hypothetical protein
MYNVRPDLLENLPEYWLSAVDSSVRVADLVKVQLRGIAQSDVREKRACRSALPRYDKDLVPSTH